MFESAKYVVQENIVNWYRTKSIAKYEILADMRDSKLGPFWEFANPVIQIFTYWFAFGYVFQRSSIDGIPFLLWLLGGMAVWLFMSPCITEGCNAIFSKVGVITKMKFPVSILPLTVVLKKLFNHLCLMVILVIVFATFGIFPNIHWIGLVYYLISAMIFATSLSLVTSVLNMIARDTRKFITSIMRLLLYLTPVLWEITRLPEWLQKIIACNPIYYIVQGYRDCFFYHRGIMAYQWSMIWFWGITLFLFVVGSFLMYKFKTKFIDLI